MQGLYIIFQMDWKRYIITLIVTPGIAEVDIIIIIILYAHIKPGSILYLIQN